jgi:hypothetical protein
MKALAEISKNQPRGRPFAKGVSGNPGGRPKRTEDEAALAEACRAKTPEALAVVESLMRGSDNDRVRLAAAQFIIERGWGRAPEKIELVDNRDGGLPPDVKLTPEEAYMLLLAGTPMDAVSRHTPALAAPAADTADADFTECSLDDCSAAR